MKGCEGTFSALSFLVRLDVPHRSRGLHHRGGACAARAGWSRAGSVRGGRRPVSNHDGKQTNETLQRPLPHLHQQAGPNGRQPRTSPAADEVRFVHTRHTERTVRRIGMFDVTPQG